MTLRCQIQLTATHAATAILAVTVSRSEAAAQVNRGIATHQVHQDMEENPQQTGKIFKFLVKLSHCLTRQSNH